MLFHYIKRTINLKFLFVIELVLMLTLLFLNFVFANYEEDYKSANRIQLGIVNHDEKDAKSTLLIENFKSNDQFSGLFEIVEGQESEIKHQFETSQLDAYVEIPEGFSDGLMHYENQSVSIFVDVQNPTKNMILSNIFRAYSNFIQGSNLATYSLYNAMEDAGLPHEKIQTINKSFSVEMVTTTLNRGQFFEAKTLSELPLVDAARYFLYALPLAFVTFLSIDHGLQYKRARDGMILKREFLIVNSALKLIFYDVFAKSLSIFLIFVPLFFVQGWLYGAGAASTFALILFLAIAFFIMLWRILSFFVNSIFGMSMIGSFAAFSLCLLSGCIVPFILLPQVLKNIGVRTPNFFLLRLSMPDVEFFTFLSRIMLLIAVIALEIAAEYALLKKESFQ